MIRPGNSGQPLVAVLCAVPLLGEGLASVLDDIAEVRTLPAGRGDTDGLLRSLRPDAVVVDTDEEALAAEDYARASQAPLVHILLRDGKLRLFGLTGWVVRDEGGASTEEIRNILVGGIFGHAGVA